MTNASKQKHSTFSATAFQRSLATSLLVTLAVYVSVWPVGASAIL